MSTELSTGAAIIAALVVAADRLTQSGYHAIEEADPRIRIVAIADSADAANAAFETHHPGVVLVDMTDERMAATTIIEALSERQPEARVLAVSGRDDVIHAESALRAGAAGFVCRSAPFEEVLRAVHVVARGENYLDPGLAQRIALQKLMGRTSSLSSLSPREYEVFCMIASGATTREIARRMHLSDKTVANYGGSIKAKLKVESTEELRNIARRAGVIG